jgi:CheY-like chemotaxis protein
MFNCNLTLSGSDETGFKPADGIGTLCTTDRLNQRVSDSAPQWRHNLEAKVSNVHRRSAKILVVEDNPADVVWLRHALDQLKEPYELEVLLDGELALRFVEEHRAGTRDPEPCVIVLDLHLPKFDGIEVLRAIKGEPVLEHIHVVMLRDEATILMLGAICRLKPSTLKDCVHLAGEILAICKGLRSAILGAEGGA